MAFLTSLLNSMPGAAAQGLAWGVMAIGVYITYKILDVADLTVDGSPGNGGAVGGPLHINGAPLGPGSYSPPKAAAERVVGDYEGVVGCQ